MKEIELNNNINLSYIQTAKDYRKYLCLKYKLIYFLEIIKL